MAVQATVDGEARPRVLAIEDDEGVASVFVRTLSAQGIDVTIAERGATGLELARTGDYELVILDLLLPDLDGISLLDRLMSVRDEQSVIVVSALANVNAKVRCLDLGAADYLEKPFALDELVARVRARLRSKGSRSSERYLSDGSLTLDFQRRLALADGRAIPLSTREFFLLEHLLRHKGQVCTRKDLLEVVWGYTFDPGTNVVDVYIRRLRLKLGSRHIETVRNVGYCLQAA
jgi:two-component system, OmpR family, response regulator